MPFNPDGTFTLTQDFGTGTPPSNDFPPQVGDVLNDIATSLDLNTFFANAAVATLDVTFNNLTLSSLVVGSPTGGNLGAGSINAQSLYVNGTAVSTGTGFLVAANNLSDVANTTTARGNLSAATTSQTFFYSLSASFSSAERYFVSQVPVACTATKFFVAQTGTASTSLTYVLKNNGTGIATVGPLVSTVTGSASISSSISANDVLTYLITGTFTGASDAGLTMTYTRVLN